MRKALLLLVRAITLRCPACGGGPLFRRWLQPRERCPGCNLKFERREGHFVGAMAFNLIAAEGVWLGGLVLSVVLTWPTPPWTAILIGSVVAMVLVPIVFYPFSRTLWYAFDLFIQPIEPGEFRG